MRSPVLGVAWYRFRATFSRRVGGYLTIVLLMGLVGGLALGSIAGARRTQSSFSTFLKSTNPSDLLVLHGDSSNDSNAPDAAFLRGLGHLAHVRHVSSGSATSVQVLGPDGTSFGKPAYAEFNSTVIELASVSGEGLTQDRPAVVHGRLLDPARADEINMDAEAARVLHLRVGDSLPFDFYTNQQTTQPDYGTGKQKPKLAVRLKLVGIVAFNFEVVRDDIDRGLRLMLFSPALTRPLEKCCLETPIAGVQLDHGARDDAGVEAEIKQSLPGATVFKVTADDQQTAARAIQPQSVALGVFGAIAALAAVLIAGQAIGRQLRVAASELDTLRALGAGPGMTLLDGAVGVVGAIVCGSLLAAIVAVALSPAAPLGPVRGVYPSKGIAFDWTVLGVGAAGLLVSLGAVATFIAYRQSPHRVARRSRVRVPRASRFAAAASASGVTVSGVAGLQLALDPGRDHRSVPLRSAIIGAVLAVVVLVGTLVFGASLSTLARHPSLYGWNWDYEIVGPYGGLGEIARPAVANRLHRDPYVASWAYASFDNLRVDGMTVPVLGTTPRAAVGPPVLSGHALDASNQIVLGASTLSALHKKVGDTVTLDNGSRSTRLVIVGTATLPAIGQGQSLHLEIGSGAVISDEYIPSRDLGFFGPSRLPQAVLVRFRPGANRALARRSLQRIAAESPNQNAGPPLVIGVQHPAEIVNYRTMGNTPALLGTALALGAIAALGLTLLASVRRRRRDLALLKTLGFRRRQLAATVAWQATVAAGFGVVIGAPLGVVAGRLLWSRFARGLHVVPRPVVPALPIALIALGALVLANLVAAIPGVQAARTKTAVLLRAE